MLGRLHHLFRYLVHPHMRKDVSGATDVVRQRNKPVHMALRMLEREVNIITYVLVHHAPRGQRVSYW